MEGTVSVGKTRTVGSVLAGPLSGIPRVRSGKAELFGKPERREKPNCSEEPELFGRTRTVRKNPNCSEEPELFGRTRTTTVAVGHSSDSD
jgi:hypothetical protein